MAYTPKTNWQKGEVLEAADMNRVEGGLSDVYTRLDTAVTSNITLKAGLQTITSDRDKPFNLSSVAGRMLLNLLGRTGTFDNVIGWGFVGATGASTTASSSYGAYSLLMTLTSTTGRVSRSVSTTAGRWYIALVDVRLGTAASGNVDVAGIGSGNGVTSSTGFQTSYIRFIATSSSHVVGCTVTGANGQTAYVDGFRVYEIAQTDYNAVPGMSAADIATLYPYTEGLAGVKNPYMIRWADANKTDVSALLAFDTELLAPPVLTNNADRDTLQQGQDGQYYKTSQWRKLQLTGALNWRYGDAGGTVFKQVAVNGLVSGAVSASGIATKYDGKIISQGNTATTEDTQAVAASGDFFISVPQADSGWGNSYTPTAEEIKVYFLGWKMYDFNNGSGLSVYNAQSGQAKGWCRRIPGADPALASSYAEGRNTLPTVQATGYTPYELMYRRSTTIIEPVPSEGAMSLVSGDNVIDVGAGLIMRESAKPQLIGSTYLINANTTPSSSLRQKTRMLLQVYRDGRPDKWDVFINVDADKLTFGFQNYRLADTAFVPGASYTVSYLPVEYYPVSSFAGSIANNEKAILDDTVRDIQQLARRVSVTELRKIDRDTGMTWITPTLLNNYTRYSMATPPPGYYKDASGRVYLKGLLTGGATGANVTLFLLPDGYRPTTQVNTVTLSSGAAIQFTIYADGVVAAYVTNSGLVSLDNISFLTNQ